MIPIIATAYPYTGQGRGGLPDAISCTVEHEVNGIYELMMEYPITGLHFDELEPGRILMATPDNMTAAQPFRIYRITKPLNGVVKVYAQHLAYDMSGTIVEPFTASTLANAITTLPTKCVPATSFTFATTKTVSSQLKLDAPRELWRLLGGSAGSFLDVYGGEWDFNLTTCTLRTRLGQDRGVEIRYGKQMTQLNQDVSLESTYAGVYPYWYDEESGTLVTLPENYVSTGSTLSSRILLLDCTDDFEDQPTVAQLRTRATNYSTNNSVGDAKMSWKVNMAMLAQSKEYANIASLEQVQLGDTVKVIYDALGVNATARVVKTEWDALGEKYTSVTIGRVKQNLATIIVSQNREVENQMKTQKSDLEAAIDAATDSIRHGEGTFRLIYSGDDLQEIVSLDDPDIDQATSVWRWNNGGFGHSANGYNGQYTLALLPNGSINASMITTGTLNAQYVKTGILTDALGKNSWNLDTGALTITEGSISITTNSASSDKISLAYEISSSYFLRNTMTPSGVTVLNEYTSSGDPGRSVKLQYYGISGSDITMPNTTGTTAGFNLTDGGLRVNGHTTGGSAGVSADPSGIYNQGFYARSSDDTASYLYCRLNPSTGLFFYKDGLTGTKTAEYPADPSTLLTVNGLRLQHLSETAWDTVNTSGTTKTYTLTAGIYLLCTARYASSSTTQDGLWIVSGYPSGTSHLTPILAPTGGTTASISGSTLSVTTGSNYVRISLFRIT